MFLPKTPVFQRRVFRFCAALQKKTRNVTCVSAVKLSVYVCVCVCTMQQGWLARTSSRGSKYYSKASRMSRPSVRSTIEHWKDYITIVSYQPSITLILVGDGLSDVQSVQKTRKCWLRWTWTRYPLVPQRSGWARSLFYLVASTRL